MTGLDDVTPRSAGRGRMVAPIRRHAIRADEIEMVDREPIHQMMPGDPVPDFTWDYGRNGPIETWTSIRARLLAAVPRHLAAKDLQVIGAGVGVTPDVYELIDPATGVRSVTWAALCVHVDVPAELAARLTASLLPAVLYDTEAEQL